ncbi:MAG: hypothetical protein ISS50_05545 [Anaerolineae bacterium]|nr:hypothetical protein [Anaerolineae bacterium]
MYAEPDGACPEQGRRISPGRGAATSATLALCYEDSEVRSGLDESKFQLYC